MENIEMRARRAATGGVREGRRQKADCRMKRRALGAANEGNRGGRGESGPSIQVNQDDWIKSDQIRPKNGPARIKAHAVGSKLARTSIDFGRVRWTRGNAER